MTTWFVGLLDCCLIDNIIDGLIDDDLVGGIVWLVI